MFGAVTGVWDSYSLSGTVTAVYCESHTEHINTLCAEKC